MSPQSAKAGAWWRVPAANGAIEGYLTKASAVPGQTVEARINVPSADTYRLRVFRLDGSVDGGTEVGCRPVCGVDRRGFAQPAATTDPITNEILVRGPNVFMGYLNLPDKTAEALDADGWLHTGDVGEVDADGYFRITDRMKDIIITAGGKNITPSEFENELKFSPYITDAVLIGDQRPYLTAIIMIDQDNVEKFAQDHDVPFSNYASLTQSQAVLDLIQSVVDQANAQFARVEQVKKFWLLDTQLSAEDEELTPTMKLKRQLVQKKYAPHIEAMYRP